MAKAKRKATADAMEILHRRYYTGKPQRIATLDQARANDHVARKLTALRIANGLNQRQLAQLIGTTACVIFRLEDANYEGHSLAMLNRIAAALNQRVLRSALCRQNDACVPHDFNLTGEAAKIDLSGTSESSVISRDSRLQRRALSGRTESHFEVSGILETSK